VEALDKQLRDFVDHLPPVSMTVMLPCQKSLNRLLYQHFRYENPDKSLDRNPEYSYIPIHRFYLATEICE
jgi:hypothetical protein